MSDKPLRELERRWKETGSVDDEAAWLGARLRAGEVERRMLELAAYLGDPAALRLLDNAKPKVPDGRPWGAEGRASEEQETEYWLYGLRYFHEFAPMRAGLACLAAAAPAVPANDPRSRWLAGLIDALSAYTLEPGPVRLAAIARARGPQQSPAEDDTPAHVEIAARRMAAIYTKPGPIEASRDAVARAWPFLVGALEAQGRDAIRALRDRGLSETQATYERVRQVVRAGLVPWALGLRDPIAERAEAP